MDFLIHWPVVATVQCQGLLNCSQYDTSAGSILEVSRYSCERSISILGGIVILRCIEYRMNR